jgi:glycosyltransferase involved in cell wall biosynthesis
MEGAEMADGTTAGRPLQIAMVAPPYFSIPPEAYGGIEAVVADLTRGLVSRGHRVTLVGHGADELPGEIVRVYDEPQSDRLGEPAPEVMYAAAAARIVDGLDVDVVHDHTLAGPLTALGRRVPTVATMHGPMDGELGDYYRELGKAVWLVAISDAQRSDAPDLNWMATVPNGIEVDNYPFRDAKEDYVLFLGRFVPEKGAHLAMDAARAAHRRIVLAGKVNEAREEEYFNEQIRPRLGDDAVYLGETDFDGKCELYGKAACLLFPVQWPEPFGLVMIEAMACGTPVVALRSGSVSEVVDDGRTGVICDTPHELTAGIERAVGLRPADCRDHVTRHFDVSVMVEGYERVYRAIRDQSGHDRG